jgi:hypothetical protein
LHRKSLTRIKHAYIYSLMGSLGSAFWSFNNQLSVSCEYPRHVVLSCGSQRSAVGFCEAKRFKVLLMIYIFKFTSNLDNFTLFNNSYIQVHLTIAIVLSNLLMQIVEPFKYITLQQLPTLF